MPDDHDGVPPGSVGTVPRDAPVGRADFERALRRISLSVESVRDDVMQLAAQVVALGDVLTRRIDGVEPHPAEPGTPAEPATVTVETAVEDGIPGVLDRIRVNDERSTQRVLLGDAEDKYTTPSNGPNCPELLHICKARCCTLHFALSTQDLDEGVIRWDYGRPYIIRQRPDDNYCTHNDPVKRGCTVYTHRPLPCRAYDCRLDERVWIDFDKKLPAPLSPYARKDGPPPTELDLMERVRARQVAFAMESFSLTTNESARRLVERGEEPGEPTKG